MQTLTRIAFIFFTSFSIQIQAFGWIDFKESDSTKRLEGKADISATVWTIPKLGRGKFNAKGSTFCIDTSITGPAIKQEDIVFHSDDFIVEFVKQLKPLSNHLFDYIISNSRTRHRLLYFSEKANPKERKLCPIKDVPIMTESQYEDAIFKNCVLLEFKKVVTDSHPNKVTHLEWNINEPSSKEPNTAPYFQTIASIKKDSQGFSYQRMGLAFDNALYGAYVMTILVHETRQYGYNKFFLEAFPKEGPPLALTLSTLGAVSLLAMRSLWNTVFGAFQPQRDEIAGTTALIRAAKEGLRALQSLKQKKPESFSSPRIDEPDSLGNTALHYAAALGHPEAVSFLLTHGASAVVLNKEQKIAANLADDANHEEISRTLCQTIVDSDPSFTDNAQNEVKGLLLLNQAIKFNLLQLVKILVPSNADNKALVNSPTSGQTPLFASILTGHSRIIEHLCQNGADVNNASSIDYTLSGENTFAQDYFKVTPEQLSIFQQCKNNSSVDPNKVIMGITPLELAVLKNKPEIVKILLAQDNIDLTRPLGKPTMGNELDNLQLGNWTLLHFAASQGFAEIAQLLVDHAPYLRQQETAGRETAADLAI
jgi:ankyrin repeat protein